MSISLTTLEDYDCDLKLIFIQTGGTEKAFIEALPKLKEPYYLLTNGKNNSLAAALEIMTYLRQHHLRGNILHGDVDDMSRNIQLLMSYNQATQKLSQSRLGVIGEPSDWLIASIPDYKEVKEKFGIELIPISLDEFYQLDGMSSSNKWNHMSFDKEEVKKANSVYDRLIKLCHQYHLDGLTLRCFDLLEHLKTTGCLALSCINDKGMIASCEGDVMAMIGMKIVSALFEKQSFQANPARIDMKKNDIVFAHCTVPMNMLTGYTLDTHFESGIGVAIKGELKKDKVTIFRISSDLRHYYLSTGNIIENLNERDLCRTQIKVHLDSDVRILLENPCGNHHILFYGDDSKILDEFLNSYGLVKVNKL